MGAHVWGGITPSTALPRSHTRRLGCACRPRHQLNCLAFEARRVGVLLLVLLLLLLRVLGLPVCQHRLLLNTLPCRGGSGYVSSSQPRFQPGLVAVGVCSGADAISCAPVPVSGGLQVGDLAKGGPQDCQLLLGCPGCPLSCSGTLLCRLSCLLRALQVPLQRAHLQPPRQVPVSGTVLPPGSLTWAG